MMLKRAQRMEVKKLMVYANLSYVRKNLDNIPKWIENNWRTGTKGKGKAIANRGAWQKVKTLLETFNISWMWEPSGATYRSVLEKANSMALLKEER